MPKEARAAAGEGGGGVSQNTSSAVMQQRAEPHDSLDFFPTPPWATRALMEHVIIPQLGLLGRKELKGLTCWEPACGMGDMAHPLTEYFGRVLASDVHDYNGNYAPIDFLMPGTEPPSVIMGGVEWIITNPPFALAEQFITRAHQFKNWRGTAMLVRSAFLEGVGRWSRLFSTNPPRLVAQFTERVPMHKGKLTATGSTATSYCWLVWMAEARSDTRVVWIPPCRKNLERASDYVSRETNSVSHRVPNNTAKPGREDVERTSERA